MPEGPELHVAGKFVNRVSEGRIYSGKVIKSAVSTKNPDVEWDEPAYTITASTRGKEIRLTLTTVDENELRDAAEKKTKDKKKKTKKTDGERKQMNILIRFGMSGKFAFRSKDEMDKHDHLNFYTKDDGMVLCFNDYRRFGRWEITDKWGKDRAPCPIVEYDHFRKNVLNNLDNVAFNKPICEVMLNQKYFNGTGNYLRAEILYRLEIPPFTRARDVLMPIKEASDAGVKTEGDDILKLCHDLPLEVLSLNDGRGHLYDPRDDQEGFAGFLEWLQCYYKEGMSNAVDSNGRTIWFKGPAGPMKPKDGKTRGFVSRMKKRFNKKKGEKDEDEPIPKKDKKSDETAVEEFTKRYVRNKKSSDNVKVNKAEAAQRRKPGTDKSKGRQSTETRKRSINHKKDIRNGSRVQPRRSCRTLSPSG